MIWDDEAEYTFHTEMEIVNVVALLVHVGVLGAKAGTQLRGDPGSEVTISYLTEPLHLAEVISMDFFRDLKAKVCWQFIDKHVKTCHIKTMIVL